MIKTKEQLKEYYDNYGIEIEVRRRKFKKKTVYVYSLFEDDGTCTGSWETGYTPKWFAYSQAFAEADTIIEEKYN
jgi:hypothetical protein